MTPPSTESRAIGSTPRIGITATSSAVPMIELELGVAKLRDASFSVAVHQQCSQQHFTFAGADHARAQAFFDYATDPTIDVLWCARGGYGATRLLPLLDGMTRERCPDPKLLVGYSDVTVLHEFVRTRWNWRTLHAPMPAAANFGEYDPAEWRSLLALIQRRPCELPWSGRQLQFIRSAPMEDIEGELVGGNLTLWCCLAGTSYQPDAQGKIIFFEDIGEAPYRLDRMMTQMSQSGMLEGVRAIVLGDFTNCNDETFSVRASLSNQDEKKSLRKTYTSDEALGDIFGAVSDRKDIPIAKGLGIGHGDGFAPLPLGARYRLKREGKLELVQWQWLVT